MIQRLLDILDITGKRKLDKAFIGRKPLTSGEFFELYFVDRGFPRETVIRIKEIFDYNVSFDLSRLAASDDFSKELKFIWNYDSLADVQVILSLEETFSITISDEEAIQMTTLDQIVEMVCKKIKAKAEQGAGANG